MLQQRRSDTAPERVVRKLLAAMGHRFRLDNRDLPGSPDIANRARKWAVFVHGCYWHQHKGCPRATVPKRNQAWWKEKFRDNQRRDAREIDALLILGYRVLVVWECQTKDPHSLGRKLARDFPIRPRPPRALRRRGPSRRSPI